eukprot:scaffold10173_cov119-Isochrysis_galbana.AAC.2
MPRTQCARAAHTWRDPRHPPTARGPAARFRRTGPRARAASEPGSRGPRQKYVGRCRPQRWSNMVAGFSRKPIHVLEKRAIMAPSTTRWSAAQLTCEQRV